MKELGKVIIGALFILLVIATALFGVPKYKVWKSAVAVETAQNEGKAEMAKAQENRNIAILEAQANLEVEELNGQAELVRAGYMAQSIEVEDGKLTDRYIKYLWVRSIEDSDKIYIPTEANMPILEVKQ